MVTAAAYFVDGRYGNDRRPLIRLTLLLTGERGMAVHLAFPLFLCVISKLGYLIIKSKQRVRLPYHTLVHQCDAPPFLKHV